MITGFNTDIEHEGVTYHVQTEDKGLDTPLILSLVYVGGEILASKRAPYDDLIQTGFSETTLVERLQRQHKLICAAIKSGRVEDLKRLGEREVSAAATKREKKSARVQEEKKAAKVQEVKAAPQEEKAAPDAPPPSATSPSPPPPSLPPPAPAPAPAAMPVSILELLTDGNVPIVPEEIIRVPVFEILPEVVVAEADETPAASQEHFAGHDDDETSGELYLKLLDDEGEFRAGQFATIRIYAGRGKYGQHAAKHAEVTVKVLGTTFRPLLLSTKTNDEGVAMVRAILPRFTSGRAAILIRAVAADGDHAELRRIIHQA